MTSDTTTLASLYNPYSLFNCFDQKEARNFWFESPTFLFRQMQRFGTDITAMDDTNNPLI